MLGNETNSELKKQALQLKWTQVEVYRNVSLNTDDSVEDRQSLNMVLS